MRVGGATGSSAGSGTPSLRGGSSAGPTLSAEEIVASKVSQFGRRRREFVQAIARRSGQPLPPEARGHSLSVGAGMVRGDGGRWRQ